MILSENNKTKILKNKFRNLIIFLFAFLGSSLIFVLLDGFIVKKEKNGYQISSRFAQRFNQEKNSSNNEISNEKWTKEIVKGGYILHLRHAMREKFAGSVTTYDALEFLNKEDARKTDYYRAVCLTERGILDSKAIGKTFKFAGIKVSNVLSSPSCRARETAIFAFNRIDQIEPAILHRSVLMESQHKAYGEKLRSVIDEIPIIKGYNIVISGHGATLSYDIKNKTGIVDIDETNGVDKRKETGIVVIERKEGKYIARHKFNSINEISNALLKLPLDKKGLEKFIFKPGDIYKPKNINRGFIF